MTAAVGSLPTGGGDNDLLLVDSPYEVARWRPLVHWLLFAPHALVLAALRYADLIVYLLYWLTLLVTGRLHPGLYGFLTMYQRYSQRAVGFLVGYSERFAPIEFSLGPEDDGAYPPVRVELPAPPPATPRRAALQPLLAVPHLVVLAIIEVAVVAVLIVGWFAVLLTGVWPRPLRDFLVRYGNYQLRVWTYLTMVDTSYPRFGV